jgi:hypothetical protein
MAPEAPASASEAGDGRLRMDGLEQCGEELTEQPPSAGRGQARAERGESSSSSTSGSSSRIINR